MNNVLMFFESTGYQTPMIGAVLLLFFYLRKQEAGVRNDMNLSLQRLQRDRDRLAAEIRELEDEIDKREGVIDLMRKDRRTVEDDRDRESRRADRAEQRLRDVNLDSKV